LSTLRRRPPKTLNAFVYVPWWWAQGNKGIVLEAPAFASRAANHIPPQSHLRRHTVACEYRRMPSYWQLLLLVLPVFALIAVGVLVRRLGWMEAAAETSLIRLAVYLCYPCLIFESIANNPALRSPGNLFMPPLVGFFVIWGSIRLGLLTARVVGLEIGTGLRTFALSAGLMNYSYLALPVIQGIWGAQSIGVLLMHNLGVEAALWTVGLLVLSGTSLRDGWRRLIGPVFISLVLAVTANLTRVAPLLPKVASDTIHALAVCAIPLGLVMTGVNLAKYLRAPEGLFDAKVSIAANLLRMGVLPALMILLARYLPCSIDLKRVIVVQAAMPSAVMPIILAQLYGGHPRTAVQIVLTTTGLGIVLIPLWLRLGMAWALS
jgi:predicted permease